MDFLAKLDALMAERKLNKRKLSMESGIPYTTINGWYTRGYGQIKLPALQSLSAFFGVTMEWLMDEERGFEDKESNQHNVLSALTLSPEALAIAKTYDTLDDHGRRMVRLVADAEAERCETVSDPFAGALEEARAQAAAATPDSAAAGK